MNKLNHIIRIMSPGILLACFCGCQGPVNVTSVVPEKEMPGMIVRVTTNKPAFQTEPIAHIEIGDKVANTVRVISKTQADVIVPNLRPDTVFVRVRKGDEKLGDSLRLTILPAPSLQLTLSFENDSVRFIRAQPRAGEILRVLGRERRRLAFIVRNEQSDLIYTGSVIHPTLGRHEVFDGLQSGERVIHRVPQPQKSVFAIKIPNTFSRTVKIQFYDVPPNFDLTDREWLVTPLRMLSEITINQ